MLLGFYIYTHMGILLLKEIALRYTESTTIKLFWDYFAMYDLWKTVGSGATSNPQSEKRREMIDYIYGEVQDRFVNKLLTMIVKVGYPLKENEEDHPMADKWTVLKKLVKRLIHGRKTKDREEMHETITGLMGHLSRIPAIYPDIYPSEVEAQQRISVGNPARYLSKVSPLIARLIQSNLQFFVGYGNTAGEAGKESKVESSVRGELKPDEKATLMELGFTIIGKGNTAASLKNANRIYLDKLSDDSYIFFSADKTTIETFRYLQDAIEYVQREWKAKMRSGRGVDRFAVISPVLPKPAPRNPYGNPTPSSLGGSVTNPELTPPPVPPAVPTNIPALGAPMAGAQGKRLGPNWEQFMTNLGFTWSDVDNGYRNQSRDTSIQVQPDNSVRVFSKGHTKNYPNLGVLFRRLNHQRTQAQPVAAGEPTAQINEANYRTLFRFLYA
jgi:hypothetical protein